MKEKTFRLPCLSQPARLLRRPGRCLSHLPSMSSAAPETALTTQTPCSLVTQRTTNLGCPATGPSFHLSSLTHFYEIGGVQAGWEAGAGVQQLWLEALSLLGHHHAWVCKAAARLAGLACAAPQPGVFGLGYIRHNNTQKQHRHRHNMCTIQKHDIGHHKGVSIDDQVCSTWQ